MRNFYFLIFLVILLALSASLIYFGQKFSDFSEKAVFANFQSDLLATLANEAENKAKFLREKPITLLFAGDIILSRGVAYQIKKYQDYRYPFLKISEFLKSADLVFGNLEGPISNRGRNQGNIYSFRANPEAVKGLKFAGFDILSLANNHIWDWGKEALEDTISILKENGIEPIGVGRNYSEANRAIIKEINKTKIAFLAYTNLYPKDLEAKEKSPGISSFDIERVKNEIKQLKEKNTNIVVISFHWGEEYKTRSDRTQQNIAYSLIEAGADLIIGHHPHIVQEIEQYKGKFIAYSLGNFVFDQNFSKETMRGLMLKVTVKNKEISEILPIEIEINSTFQPEIKEL